MTESATDIVGEVLSVSVSLPQMVEMGEMTWLTSIIKEPGAGPVMISQEGPEGNKSAVHPEAVYAIGAEAYDYWAERLGVDRAEWQWGRWGENITFRGLYEKDLRVGDIIAVGDTLVMQVSGARNPCVKLSWRLGQPVTLLATLIESGVMGFYLRVLTPGLIKAGDMARVSRTHPGNMAIIDIPRLIHDRAAPSEQVRRALEMPALSDYAKMFLRQRLSQSLDNEIAGQNRWSGWRDFVISRIVEECRGVRSFYFRPVDGGEIAGYRPGQFLTFRIPDGQGRTVQRQWSISDYGAADDTYRISVRRVDGGSASAWMHDETQIGTVVPVKAPAGRFTLDIGSTKPIIFISAGIGITPLLAMLKAHAARQGGQTPLVIWIHAAREGDSHAFKDEVQALIDRGVDIRPHIFYSRPGPEDRHGIDYDVAGRIDIAAIRRIAEKIDVNLAGRVIEIAAQICEFYLCGPAEMQRSLREDLIAWGVSDHSIHAETFSPPTARDTANVGKAEIVFAESGRTLVWRGDDDLSLLELAEAAGIEAPSNCRMGTCHSCLCRISSGKVEHRVELEGLDDSHALLCCAVPASDRVVLQL